MQKARYVVRHWIVCVVELVTEEGSLLAQQRCADISADETLKGRRVFQVYAKRSRSVSQAES